MREREKKGGEGVIVAQNCWTLTFQTTFPSGFLAPSMGCCTVKWFEELLLLGIDFSVLTLAVDMRLSFPCTEARDDGMGTGRPAALAAATRGSCNE